MNHAATDAWAVSPGARWLGEMTALCRAAPARAEEALDDGGGGRAPAAAPPHFVIAMRGVSTSEFEARVRAAAAVACAPPALVRDAVAAQAADHLI
jgi:hypothetical protein